VIPVANAKRVSRIEAALTPKQVVMLWLSQEQGRTSVKFCRHLLQLPRSAAPSSKVGTQVAMAIRTAMKGQDSERIAQAVRQARMEADFLILLINRANFLVLADNQVRWLKIVLLYERRHNLALSENGAEDLDEFVQYLRTTAIEILAMQAATKAVQAQYFDGQEILLKDVADDLAEQARETQGMIKIHDMIAANKDLPELSVNGPEFQSAVDKLAGEKRDFIVALAKSQMLEDFGEVDAADAVINPHFLAALSETEIENMTT
jgi:hypothetical protein